MASNPPGHSPYAHQQPFPGAVPVSGPGPAMSSQPRPVMRPRAVMDIPPPLPRPSFLLRTDGSFSDESARLFADWGNQISHHLTAIPDAANGGGLVRPRWFLLSDACRKRDIVYLVMHQRFCMWSRHRQIAHQLMRPYPAELVDSGFTALEVLLKANDDLPIPYQDWFCNFPDRSFDPYLPTQMMEPITQSIIEFTMTLSTNWRRFQALVVDRRFPILTWEAELILKCVSPVTQDLLFTLSRRLLGCQDGQLAHLFNELFNKDRNFESNARARHLPAEEIQRFRDWLAREYNNLVRRAHLATANMNQSPLVSPSPGVGLAATPTRQMDNTFPRPVNSVHRPETEPRRDISWPSQSVPTGLASANPVMGQARNMTPSVHTIPVHQSHTSTSIPPAVQQAATPTDNKPLARPSHTPAAAAGQQTFTSALALLPAEAPPDRGQLRLIPETEYPYSAYGETSLKVGLHLALQRSPRRIPMDRRAPSAKFYQYVDNLVVQPTKLNASPHLIQINFLLSDKDVQNLPVEEIASGAFSVPTVTFQNYTCRFRLRVCRVASGVTKVSESEWAATNSFWPQLLVVAVNSKPCILSRKQHFHADLPLEISPYVKSGRNEISISFPNLTGKERGGDYFIAVERVTTQNYVSVRARIDSNPHITAETTRDAFKHSFEPGSTNEIIVLGRTLNVSVSDPLSAKLCDIPVIGAGCKHMDCFDLENWLRSRPRKPEADNQEPCLVDCWGCPICGSDVRPGQLRINDYFVEVGRQLRETANFEVKMVAVGTDGNWKPLIEEPSGGRHSRPGKSSEPRDMRQRSHQAIRDIEVIEILDD